MDDRIAGREEKARKMVALWERKSKTAKTRLAKWRKKVAYYEKRTATAALSPRPEPKPRAPKVVDLEVVDLRLKGSTEGEFRCLIVDLSRETEEADRNAMAEWLSATGVPGGYRFKVDASNLAHVKVLESELEHWQHHNEITSRRFPNLLYKVCLGLSAYERRLAEGQGR